MKALEFLRKISFREGFFCIAMLVVVATWVVSFVQAPTEKTLAGGNVVVVLCLLALCFLTDFPKFSSKQSAERMENIALLWIILLFFVILALMVCYAVVENIVFTRHFFALLCVICLMYLGLVMFCGGGFLFNYKEPQKRNNRRSNRSEKVNNLKL